MFSVILVLLFCTVIHESNSGWNMRPPHHPPWSSTWVNGLVNTALTKLTTEIYRDALTKMKTIKANGKVYQKQSMFAIGTLTSNIYSLFDKMVMMYQEVSSLEKTRERNVDSKWQAVSEPTTAFGICQGLYHQIRLEKKLFQELIRSQAIEFEKKNKQFAFNQNGPPPGSGPEYPKGGMFVGRRTIADDLFDEDDFDSNFELPMLSKRNTKHSKDFQKIGRILVAQKPSAKKYIARNPYAPPPTNQSDHLNMQKPAGPFAFPIPTVSIILPTGFTKQPSNSNILKLMAQLNKDNPHLNPDFGAYLPRNRKGDKPDRNDAVELPMAGLDIYSVQSRRSESGSYRIAQLSKMGSNSHPAVKKPRGSNSYPAVAQPRLESDSYDPAQPPRGYNSYMAVQNPRFGSDRYAAAQKPRGSNSYRAIQPQEFRSRRDPKIQPPILEYGSHVPVQASRMQHSGDGAPKDGSRSFNNRGRLTTTTRATKRRWKPNKQN